MTLWVASKNKDKIEEIKRILKNFDIKILSLLDIQEKVDIIEDGITLSENALKKAEAIYKIKKEWAMGEDTGLEVDVLYGKPGVFSARYSGGGYRENRLKLLKEMEGVKNRNARFRTVIALISPSGERYFFEGEVKGVITEEERGNKGVG